ncbi:MAG: tRNA (N(6)-L-threonylcarbamoyladenosine(37)-C(2))-methylthiotransferase MtaB [Clostridiaceae bacterium]|nr:tRNA (N(6)-L-threonylcarbamoyladenosine(37)-C(2))-methylthiotransferase MtaB [Clostridiaceae bacterium]
MENTKKVAFITLGCKVNTAETEGMKKLFRDAGYEIVSENEYADVYIVNTCTVTNTGDRKSRQMLRKAHKLNPNAVIAAVGCFAQVSPDEAAKIEGVNLVVGNNLKHNIVELVEKNKVSAKQQKYVHERRALCEFEELPIETYEDHTRAFIKVQDGCDQFCSYCIIPYARGPVRSRKMDDVLREAKNLVARGFGEVVLTGIHLTSYGKKEGVGLAQLIEELHNVEGIERIRLGSLEPMFLTSDFIDHIKNLPKLCPHFHISLQSGCDSTLKRMNRRYTTQDYRNIVNMLKEKVEDVTITTDVMVGFPGETDEEFQQSYEFCKEMGFLRMHVFKYSPRKGTPAARYPHQVDGKIKEERSRVMINLAEAMQKDVMTKFIGREMPVLLEQPVAEGCNDLEGHTPNYIPVIVEFDSENVGEIINVRLDNIENGRVRAVAL